MSHFKTPRKNWRWGYMATCSALLAACAVGPNFTRPSDPSINAYDQDGLPDGVVLSRNVDAQWWDQFGTPSLNHLVHDAMVANAGLDAAEATLRESEAVRRAGAGVFYPNVAMGYGMQRERSAPSKLGVGAAGSIFNLFTLGATVAYQLDIWGGNRRAVEALSANVDEARYSRDASRLSLAANVVDTAIAESAYDEQVRIAQHDIELAEKQLAIVVAQIEAGVQAKSAELAQQAQLDTLRSALPPLIEKQAASRHLMASLMGKAPVEWSGTTPAWSEWQMPLLLTAGMPSELVHRRPDILVAEARLHAATAQLGVATADLYPSLTLGADGGWASNKAGQLGNVAGRYWDIGPSINLPLFSGGADLARRDSARAGLDVAAAEYRQTVVLAFNQVADVLASVKQDKLLADERNDAVNAWSASYELAKASHQAGTLTDMDFITIELQMDSARLAAIGAKAQSLQDAVALYLAIGGGTRASEKEAAP